MIAIDVVCVDVTSGSVACTAPSYYPEKSYGLSGNLVGTIAVGSPFYVAQSLFDSFVESSSDPNLASVEKRISAMTDKFMIDGFTEGYGAGRDACGAAKKTPASPQNN